MNLKKFDNKANSNLVSVIGYGTFITKGKWKDNFDVEVCHIKNFIRVQPKGNWFPYVLHHPNNSFWALKFCISSDYLEELDRYECVSEGLFKRIKIKTYLKNNREEEAFIYVPTENTIASQKLTPDIDKIDNWREEIKKFPEIVKKFPELIL